MESVKLYNLFLQIQFFKQSISMKLTMSQTYKFDVARIPTTGINLLLLGIFCTGKRGQAHVCNKSCFL